MKTYDAIIIGAGQAGVPLARKLAAAGRKTALIEKHWVGGTCVNAGCTPTKTLIASGQMAYMAAHADEWGIEINDFHVHMPAVKKRKDDLVAGNRNGLEQSLLQTENLDLVYGVAAFTDAQTITVQLNAGGSEAFTAGKIFINTGAKPAIPDIAGLDTVAYLTSDTILYLDEVPEHLLIVGASYVALEFGQLYRRLGSKVTVLEASGTFLGKEDEDIAASLKSILEEEGLTIHTNAALQLLAQTTYGIKATVAVGGTVAEINCSHILLAVGRPPQTEGLDLQNAGIETGAHGEIKVNERLETNVPGIYALGDVKGGPAFTHIAYNDFVIVWQNLLQGADRSVKDRPLPYCMYTDPQLGRVGITEKEAREKGLNIKVASMPMTAVARARETGHARGLMKAVVDADTRQILGVAVLGVEGGELMTVLQMAMAGGITYDQLQYMVFAHPTLAESINNLFTKIN
jgi:pyruvate/2-oxoglutarate dehydrogenase complex dihydrolipoamide dehydrogenase (E3) component